MHTAVCTPVHSCHMGRHECSLDKVIIDCHKWHASTKVVGGHFGSSVALHTCVCVLTVKSKKSPRLLIHLHGSGAGPALTLSESPGRAEILLVAFGQVLSKPRESSIRTGCKIVLARVLVKARAVIVCSLHCIDRLCCDGDRRNGSVESASQIVE